MRINERIKVRSVAGENVVIMPGAESTDMTRVVGLNESALMLYNRLNGREFGLDEVVGLLTEVYAVEDAVARRDAEAWLDEMKKNNMLE